MSTYTLDKINKLINRNLKEEDLKRPGFSYFVGRFQKKSKKAIKKDYRLYVDAVIEIYGLENYTMGIRSYKIDDEFWELPPYQHWFKERNDKFYDVKSERVPVSNITQAFKVLWRIGLEIDQTYILRS